MLEDTSGKAYVHGVVEKKNNKYIRFKKICAFTRTCTWKIVWCSFVLECFLNEYTSRANI